MDILNDRNFDLNSLVIQTSTIGNIKTLSTFAEKHCKNLEKFTLTALRLPPKGLSLLFRIDLKRIKMICGVLEVTSKNSRRLPENTLLFAERKKIQKMIRLSFDCMSYTISGL